MLLTTLSLDQLECGVSREGKEVNLEVEMRMKGT
jgi:hypothetical protein